METIANMFRKRREIDNKKVHVENVNIRKRIQDIRLAWTKSTINVFSFSLKFNLKGIED